MSDGAPTVGDSGVAQWLRPEDELPHAPAAEPGWSENYLTYGWSPHNNIGVYFHICRRPGPIAVYEENIYIYLPGDLFLVHHGFSKVGPAGSGPVVAGLRYTCEESYARWRKTFRGACRLVSGDELRAGPLRDGPRVDVDLGVTVRATSPAFDFGSHKLDQAWGQGHYEQHHEIRGQLTWAENRVELRGHGLRDHSWGPRDWSGVGDTSWYHGQFPSGRSFMVVSVPGRPPFPPFLYGVMSDHTSVTKVEVTGIPDVTQIYQTGGLTSEQMRYVIGLRGPHGTSRIHAEVVQSMPLTFLLPAEIGLGSHRSPTASHENVETITRFTWDEEVGYGLVTACRELAGAHGDRLQPFTV